MLAPFTSFLDSELEGLPDADVLNGNRNDFSGEVDVTGTLFATLLTDVPNIENSYLSVDTMSSNSEAESEDMFQYLSTVHCDNKAVPNKESVDNDIDDNLNANKELTAHKACKRMTRSRNTANGSENAEKNKENATYNHSPLMCSGASKMISKSLRIKLERTDDHVDNENNQGRDKCMNRNAIIARENREKKKQYIKHLETNLERVNLENFDLKSKYSAKSKLCESLQNEVKYLRNVLANQSSLTKLLRNIHATQNVSFTSSLLSSDDEDAGSQSQKRNLDENDNIEQSSKGVYVRATGSHKKVKKEVDKSKSSSGGFNSPLTPCPSPEDSDVEGDVAEKR